MNILKRLTLTLAGAGMVMASGLASAQAGWGVESVPTWPKWQTRLAVGTQDTPLSSSPWSLAPEKQIGGLSIVGDYYFFRGTFIEGAEGGFRTTGGVVAGRQSLSLLGPATGAAAHLLGNGRGLALSASYRHMGSTVPGMATDDNPLPYLGVGYTSVFERTGLRLSADVGVLALGAGNIKFGHNSSTSQSLDELLRQLRLMPAVQIGISYAF